MIRTTVSRESELNRFQRDLDSSMQQKLGVAGSFLESKMVEKIQTGLNPPLLADTVQKKGSDTPLVDTGELLSQISHNVSGDTVEVGVFGSRAKIAKHHEFGAPAAGIPERSFMRSALRENRNNLKKIIKQT